MSDASRAKATLYVGGLASQVTTHVLHDAFIPFGEIIDVSIPPPELPSSTEPHRGFGYVEFEHAADAKEAIDNMDQSELLAECSRSTLPRSARLRARAWGEGYLAKYAVSEEDRRGAEGDAPEDEGPMDPMQGLEQLDVAGPKLA
ncbi:hypothetical protein H2203_005704 [Taxawa tesnikishii (nom. ined.)]|nr:hypothetical protein H2203_005704 [Dothideales sp. JES 119]